VNFVTFFAIRAKVGLGRTLPRVRFAIESLLGLLFRLGLAALYGTIIYLNFKK